MSIVVNGNSNEYKNYVFVSRINHAIFDYHITDAMNRYIFQGDSHTLKSIQINCIWMA